MPNYHFPGYPAFVERAARNIGRPRAAAAAPHITPLIRLADLCAQVAENDLAHAAAILERADEYRDQLRTAYEAAELILQDARARCGLETDPRSHRVVPEIDARSSRSARSTRFEATDRSVGLDAPSHRPGQS